MSNRKEWPINKICPCGSGKKYGNCCKKKSFKYVVDNRKTFKEIPINQEMFEILQYQEQLFFEYYGRKPKDDEYVFQFMPIYNDELLIKSVYLFRQLGIDERLIYAYYKSDGLIPCDVNIDLLSQKELKEYKALC
jgi:hypothetical protein